MPMTQSNIREHYEAYWRALESRASDDGSLNHCSEVENQVVGAVYRQLVRDMRVRAQGGKILDVGCGSGRWVRYFLSWFQPELLVGIDAAASSIELMRRRHLQTLQTRCLFHQADITAASVDLHERFDLINVANVLFHIPEHDLHLQAMRNLAKLVAPDGVIITTSYLPHTNMRTEWMLVRSRYDFEAIAAAVGLRIVAIRPFAFFANDPMGIDGPDNGLRGRFQQLRAQVNQMLAATTDPQSRAFVVNFLTTLERTVLEYCDRHVSGIDLPSQKLVVLQRAD